MKRSINSGPSRWWRPWRALLVALLLAGVAAGADLVPPRPIDFRAADLDGNGVADALDRSLADRAPAEEVRVLVLLTEPVLREQLARFVELGGRIRHTFRHVCYGFSGTISAGRIAPLAESLGEALAIVREAQSGAPALDYSTTQVRVRDGDTGDSDDAFVWSYGYTGDPASAVAIAGSGITLTHDDLGDSPDDDTEEDPDDWGDPTDASQVLLGWYDSTPDSYFQPRDDHGHESHIAGIVAGRGTVSSALRGLAPDTHIAGLKFWYYDGGGTLWIYDDDFVATADWVLDTDGYYLDNGLIQGIESSDYGDRAVPTLGDLDGDGDLDLIIGSASGQLYGARQGSSAWANDNSLVNGLPSANPYAAPALGDLDGDGDLDLLVGQFNSSPPPGDGIIVGWNNTGSATSPSWTIQMSWAIWSPDLNGDDRPAPALGDLDGDGDLDVVVGTQGGSLLGFENIAPSGQPAQFLWNGNLVSGTATGAANTQPALADLDGDGDLDLLVGTSAGKLITFRNIGSAGSPTWSRDPGLAHGLSNTGGGGYAAPAFGDADGNGSIDVVAGRDDGTLIAYNGDGVVNRDRFGIKVFTLSSNWPSNGNFDLMGAVETLVANGVVVTCSAGNGHDNGTGNPYYYVSYPARSPKVITVGSTTTYYSSTWDQDIVAGYSSNGDPNDDTVKPDVLAPGGGHYLEGGTIRSVDSGTADGYRNDWGTSFATPHVAGAAALLIEAIEQAGGSWQYTEQEVLAVKALIQMTATETVLNGEDPGGDPQNPPLDRGGKDRVEGYGRINADAAVEAATLTWDGSNTQGTLGNGPRDKKCWARETTLSAAGAPHSIELTVPAGADFDLYLYETAAGTNGEPVIAHQSTQSGDADETITVANTSDVAYYVVVKWVSGSGDFTIVDTFPTPDCGNVVENGDFNSGVLDPWVFVNGYNPPHPEPVYSIEDIPPMASALRFYRDPDFDGSHALAQQDLNLPVPAGATVHLELDVRIDYQNFSNYSSWNVYPANVTVVYLDQVGATQVFKRSWYIETGPGVDPPPAAEQIPPSTWVHRAFDLGTAPAISEIVRIVVSSVGWSYDAAFDNVTLGFCGAEPDFVRGECNADGQFNIADAIYLLGFLFPPAPPPDPLPCEKACDTNDDGQLNIADAIAILGALFPGGGPPFAIPDPFPLCGPDPTPDALECAQFPLCP